MTEQTTPSRRAYNVKLVQINDETVGTNANDKTKITLRAKGTIGGREVERTVVAQGAAADKIAGLVGKGNELYLRVLFDRAPANEDGKRGGEYLTVVDLPREREVKADKAA